MNVVPIRGDLAKLKRHYVVSLAVYNYRHNYDKGSGDQQNGYEPDTEWFLIYQETIERLKELRK